LTKLVQNKATVILGLLELQVSFASVEVDEGPKPTWKHLERSLRPTCIVLLEISCVTADTNALRVLLASKGNIELELRVGSTLSKVELEGCDQVI
jgi:hypothetical protein